MEEPNAPNKKKRRRHKHKPRNQMSARERRVAIVKVENPEGGRPKKEIDWRWFKKLCAMQCTLVEIAANLEVSHDTVERGCKERYGKNFGEVWAEFAAGGNVALRRAQHMKALRGDTTMQIFLGLNRLGQSNNRYARRGNSDEQPIEIESLERALDEMSMVVAEEVEDEPTRRRIKARWTAIWQTRLRQLDGLQPASASGDGRPVGA